MDPQKKLSGCVISSKPLINTDIFLNALRESYSLSLLSPNHETLETVA